ncbi:MAG: thioredoxin domain-containing protein [Planctomycetota bacterium]
MDAQSSTAGGSAQHLTKRRHIAAIVIAIAGLTFSLNARVTSARYQATHAPSVCVVSAYWNCDTVMQSEYSTVFGISISTLAVIAHLLVIALLWGARANRSRLVLSGALAGVAGIAGLAYFAIAYFSVKSGCLNCLAIQISDYALAALLVPPAIKAARGGLDSSAIRFATVTAALLFVIGIAGEDYATQTSALARAKSGAGDNSTWVDLSDAVLYGKEDAPLRVVIYADFGCPHCEECYRKARKLTGLYPDDVAFVFKHWPLDTDCNPEARSDAHRGACRAARAAQVAALNGHGQEAVDYLFGANQGFNPFFLARLGERIGMDKKAWNEEIASAEVDSLVTRDVEEGHDLGLTSVPSAYIDGRRIDAGRITEIVKKRLGR